MFPLEGGTPEPWETAIVLRALMTLQRACVLWHRSMHEVAVCCGCTGGRPSCAPMMTVDIGKLIGTTTTVAAVVRRVRDACSVLQRHVLPFDRVLFGDTIESIDELVARGQLLVAMACLRHLRDVMPPVSVVPLSTDPVRVLLEAFPGGIGEVIRYAELEVHRIGSLWTQLRQRDERIPGGLTHPIVTDDKRLHRKAVIAAQREMCGLIDHPRFGAFLAAGVERDQPPEVRTACIRIATALQVRLSAELTLPLPQFDAGADVGAWRRTAQQPVSA